MYDAAHYAQIARRRTMQAWCAFLRLDMAAMRVNAGWAWREGMTAYRQWRAR